MLITVIMLAVAVLIGPLLILIAIGKIKPAVFKISATATKWFSITLEAGSPAAGGRRPGRPT